MTDQTIQSTLNDAALSGDVDAIQTAYRAVHPSHRAAAQTAAMMFVMAEGGTTDSVATFLGAINDLPAATASRTVARLSDEQWESCRDAVATDVAVLVQGFADGATDDLHRAAYLRLQKLAVDAVVNASSGARSTTNLVPLSVGTVLTHGDHSVTVTDLTDDGVPLVGDEKLSLSAAAGAITGHPTNGRAYWKLDGKSIIA